MARTKLTAQQDAAATRRGVAATKGLSKSTKVPRKQADTPKNDDAADAGVKKQHRWRSGTVALREIRYEQKNAHLKPAIPRAPFERYVKEVGQKAIHERALPLLSGAGGVRWQKKAVDAVYQAAENIVVPLMKQSVLNMAHAKRRTMQLPDLMLSLSSFNAFAPGTIKFDLRDSEDPGAAEVARRVKQAEAEKANRPKAPRKAAVPKRNKSAAPAGVESAADAIAEDKQPAATDAAQEVAKQQEDFE